tara:strand:- start:1190 stop:1756 length:567 start_codon:yes stop_codon:yes gene_type:complete
MMVGASSHAQTEREQHDYYATEPVALEKFLDAYVKRDGCILRQNIWEPACGEGHLSEVLLDRGYRVQSTDLINRGYGDGVVDFLEFDVDIGYTDILTNPPFKLAEEFVRHGLKLADRVIIFQRIHFLESQKRYQLFQDFPARYIYVHSSRVGTAMNGDFDKYKAKAMCYAWYVFERKWRGNMVLRCIP